MGHSDARFRREYFGFVSAKQVSADFPSGCTGNCTSGSDQFTHANAAEADFAWRTRRLSRQRDLGLQPGRSRNRRRVDYNRRREMLETLSTATPQELIQT